MARCRAFSECSGSCCVPDRDPGWPMLPVSVDSPRSDSPQPCGQPKQQFPCALDADREFDTDTQRSFRQSIFGATSTKFPARRWSPLAQHLSPKLFGSRRQSPSLVIVELETPVTHLFSKDPILLDQI